MKLLPVILLILSFSQASYCQKIYSSFKVDSLIIGQLVELHIWTNHPSDSSVLFPDSTYNYTPFEFIAKKFFPTKTENNISRDCTIYKLRTFDTRSKHEISLPIYYLSENDTIIGYANPAAVYLQSLIKGQKGFKELKEQSQYIPVREKINYPLIISILALVLLISLIFFKLFGKTIIKRYKIVSAIFAHIQFLKAFEQLEKSYYQKKDVQLLEQLQSLWKNYLTKLEEKPVSTYTSTEIIKLYRQEDLKNSLRVLDGAIFGKILSSEEDKAVKILKSFTNKRYIIRKNEIRRS